MKRTLVSLLLISLFIGIAAFPLPSQASEREREDIAAQYKWNLSDIYASWEKWETGLATLESLMDEFAALKGTLSQGPDALYRALELNDRLNILAYRVYRYPQLTSDLDTRDQFVSQKLQQVQLLFAKFGTATAWFNPELLQIPWETVDAWLHESPRMEPYIFGISDLYRQQEHVLDEDKERILSFFSTFNGTPRSIYTELSTSDIDFPTVTLSTGEELRMTSGNYSKTLATNRNQEDRRLAFETHYQVYAENKNTYSAIYNAVCQRDWAAAQARNYASTLSAALDGNNIPTEVYENLVTTVKENADPLHRYIALRKKTLGLEEYHSYDGSITLSDFDKNYPYEDIKDWIIASVKPLGKDYQQKLKAALSAGWIDVFENTGKRPGAYSANVYGIHPYMLMNYNETLDNVFTLAHELGHTMHTTLSNENQPFALHSYTIFVAEVASTFNERLLLDYLLEKSKDPRERVALLQQAIRNISGTFFFQTLLADYEWQVHQLVEQGNPITANTLSGIMGELMTTYYGDEFVKDDLLDFVWARIGHFYRTPYYVYQYATSFAASAALYDKVMHAGKKDRKQALDQYLTLLKSGGNDYPIEQLRKAGVDLTQAQAITAVIRQLDELVSLLEKELQKL